MFTWIAANVGTILITLVLAGVVAAVVTVLIRDRKKGRSSCGGNCGHCPMNCSHCKR
ncbi:MAG: FeoB-associated Cys-rich membrane protein [Oscillospiraceae bacterium]|nr:FeoB-associated Cys-rich membrane protein [Oscillospiraceae bacterium]